MENSRNTCYRLFRFGEVFRNQSGNLPDNSPKRQVGAHISEIMELQKNMEKYK